jgi:predicted GNAT family N-acyltransferase
VLTALERVARERHVKNLSLHAQMQAQGFYAKHHYVTLGEPFEEAGIVHIEMQKVL